MNLNSLIRAGYFVIAVVTAAVQALFVMPVLAQSSSQSQVQFSEEQVVEVQPITSSAAYAEVAYTKGNVSYRLANTSAKVRAAFKGSKLFQDCSIQTGANGFASLKLSTNTILNIQPMSRVRLTGDGCSDTDALCAVTIETEYGDISASSIRDDAPTTKPTRFMIETPFHSAAVRGPSVYISKETLKSLLDSNSDVDRH